MHGRENVIKTDSSGQEGMPRPQLVCQDQQSNGTEADRMSAQGHLREDMNLHMVRGQNY